MKKLVFTLIIFTCSLHLFAGNPGSNYACWSYSNNKFYTSYWKDDIRPGWGIFLYHYYNDASGVINGTYNNPNCGEINPNNSYVWFQTWSPCFININGSIYQGNLGTINYNNYNQCNAPLDDSISILFVASAAFTFVFLRKQQKLAIWN
ncbi:hypothetical protein [Pedobacter sp. KLB.chiD]|uniref:hypothetical protein n=1 Tax=Pedobacter sp. KLB.chiD TaxID=3387402 RepID=UPI00399A3F67